MGSSSTGLTGLLNGLTGLLFENWISIGTLPVNTVRIFQNWGVGQRDKDNGAILFVFLNDRKMRIEVGYGLEPVLTDAESARIIEAMKPAFRSGDFAEGLALAVNAMIAATQGEYRGTGKTVRETERAGPTWFVFIAIAAMCLFAFVNALMRVRRGLVYDHRGRYQLPGESGGWWMSSGGGWSGSSGGWSSGGGGGFSGGGGSSGGGGASGSW